MQHPPAWGGFGEWERVQTRWGGEGWDGWGRLAAHLGQARSLGGCGQSVGVSRVSGPFQLHLQPLHADLKAIHGLDGSLRASWVVKAHEACRDRGGPRWWAQWASSARSSAAALASWLTGPWGQVCSQEQMGWGKWQGLPEDTQQPWSSSDTPGLACLWGWGTHSLPGVCSGETSHSEWGTGGTSGGPARATFSLPSTSMPACVLWALMPTLPPPRPLSIWGLICQSDCLSRVCVFLSLLSVPLFLSLCVCVFVSFSVSFTPSLSVSVSFSTPVSPETIRNT